jgi:hypothetical protein
MPSKLTRNYYLSDFSDNLRNVLNVANQESTTSTISSTSGAQNSAYGYTLNEKIILNARGFKYEILLNLMDRVKHSRLAKLKKFIEMSRVDSLSANEYFTREKLCDGFNSQLTEFFFNKDPHMLGVVLNFYEPRVNKHTHINFLSFCPYSLEDELAYWNIRNYECLMEPCCLLRLEKAKEKIDIELKKERIVIDELNHKEDFADCCFSGFRECLWNIMDNPKSSICAAIYTAFSTFMILVSIFDIGKRIQPKDKNLI